MTNKTQKRSGSKFFRSTVGFSEEQFLKIKEMQSLMGCSISSILRKAVFDKDIWNRPIFTDSQFGEIFSQLREQEKLINELINVHKSRLPTDANSLLQGVIDGFYLLSGRLFLCHENFYGDAIVSLK